jgi:hypothetical protein
LKASISFVIETDIHVTDAELREWVEFNLHLRNLLPSDNPLLKIEMASITDPDIRRDGNIIKEMG